MQSLTLSPRLAHWADRFSYALPLLAAAGAAVCFTQLYLGWQVGGWPPHDSTAYWVAGVNLRNGAPVYDAVAGEFLAFLYAPPWAVIFGALSVLPVTVFCAGLLVAQVLGLRYVLGSWTAAGLLAWLPIVPEQFSIGNIDFLIAAAILAGVTRSRFSGATVALFSFAKVSPVLTLSGATWRQAVAAGLILVAITVPWWHLWPEWIGMLARSRESSMAIVPILPRLPIVVVLLALRRPWSVAAAAALATPAFYLHSLILFLPAIRLALRPPLAAGVDRRTSPTAAGAADA